MKKFPRITAAVLAAAVLILAGCGIAETDGPDEKLANRETVRELAENPVPVPTPVAVPVPTAEDEFLATMDEYGVDYGAPAEGIAAGRTICTYLDEGGSLGELIYEVEFDLTGGPLFPSIANDDLDTLIGAAVGNLCPEHINAVIELGK